MTDSNITANLVNKFNKVKVVNVGISLDKFNYSLKNLIDSLRKKLNLGKDLI